MQNTQFLVILRSIFALKEKIAPPIGIGNKNVTTLTLDLKGFRRKKSISPWANTSFVLFFGLHLISGTTAVQIQVQTFFCFGLEVISGTKAV